MRIRHGREDDLPRLLEIYNHYIQHSHATFDTELLGLHDRLQWFSAFTETGRHRLYVVETGEGLMGYASSQTFRARAAYDRSVETSVYLAPESHSAGLGSALYAQLLEALEEDESVHRAYGGVSLPNEPSVALHQRFGFKRVATFSEVGFKFGRYWDVAWFERAV